MQNNWFNSPLINKTFTQNNSLNSPLINKTFMQNNRFNSPLINKTFTQNKWLIKSSIYLTLRNVATTSHVAK